MITIFLQCRPFFYIPNLPLPPTHQLRTSIPIHHRLRSVLFWCGSGSLVLAHAKPLLKDGIFSGLLPYPLYPVEPLCVCVCVFGYLELFCVFVLSNLYYDLFGRIYSKSFSNASFAGERNSLRNPECWIVQWLDVRISFLG